MPILAAARNARSMSSTALSGVSGVADGLRRMTFAHSSAIRVSSHLNTRAASNSARCISRRTCLPGRPSRRSRSKSATWSRKLLLGADEAVPLDGARTTHFVAVFFLAVVPRGFTAVGFSGFGREKENESSRFDGSVRTASGDTVATGDAHGAEGQALQSQEAEGFSRMISARLPVPAWAKPGTRETLA